MRINYKQLNNQMGVALENITLCMLYVSRFSSMRYGPMRIIKLQANAHSMLNRQQNQKKRDRKSKSACSHANATNQMSTSNSYSHSWQIYLFSKREHFGIIHACMYGNPFVPSAMVVVVAVTAYSIVIVVVVVDAVSALLFILSFNKMT